MKFLLEGRNLSLSEGKISQKAVYAGRQWDNEFGQKRSPLVKGKRPKRGKMKEGYLFSLNGVKKVERNLGTKESFPVFPFCCLSVFSQVYSCPDDETEDPFEEAGDIGNKIIHKLF